MSALAEIMSKCAYNNIILRKTLARNNALSRQDKAFVTELVNGVLRNLILLDYMVSHFSKTPTTKMKPFVLDVLRTAVYQIIFMDKTPNFAVCDESVKLIKKRGLKGLAPYVNGVLRNISRDWAKIELPKGDLCIKYSYPRWIIDYWLTRYDQTQTEAICRGLHRTPRVCVMVNTLRTDKAALIKILRDDGINVSNGFYLEHTLTLSGTSDISALKAFRDGLFFVVDEASVLAAAVMAPTEGARILDVCSAPGGKTWVLACMGKDNVQIRAFDIFEHKIALMESTRKRLGITCVTTAIGDATVFNPELESSADYVLLDAPCSGLGLVRKKPEIKYRKTLTDIEELAHLQYQMLENVSRYVAPGGYLLYSVCTISPRECEGVVKRFITNHPFELEPITDKFMQKPGLVVPLAGCVQVLPIIDDADADGFFIAKLRRKGVVS